VRALALATAAVLGLATAAEAATFEPIYKGVSMVMTGDIVPGDARRFVSAWNASCKRYGRCPERLFLNSGGGEVEAGLDLAIKVHETKAHTVVGKTDQCYSMCVIIFAVGSHRAVFETSRIGVHRTSDANGNDVWEMTAVIADLMRELGMPASVIGKFWSASPQSMAALDVYDMAGWAEIIGSGDAYPNTAELNPDHPNHEPPPGWKKSRKSYAGKKPSCRSIDHDTRCR
jgi:hypothetical protein